MPNYRRVRAGNTYFFTVVTHQRRPFLCIDKARRFLREAVNTVRESYPFLIKAWVLLPDHMHCIWELPEGDVDYSKRWGMIKAGFSKRAGSEIDEMVADNLAGIGRHDMVGGACPTPDMVGGAHPTLGLVGNAHPTQSRVSKREGTIWQRRFWEHMIRDDRDFSAHCDYIHYNPVKHGLVKAPLDWPYSTLRRFVGKGLYPKDWGAVPVEFMEGVGRE